MAFRCGYHCARPLIDAFGVDETVRERLAPYNSDVGVETLREELDASPTVDLHQCFLGKAPTS